MSDKQTCPDCGKEFKNLGSHTRYCKGNEIKEEQVDVIEHEEQVEQPLSKYPLRITKERVYIEDSLTEEEKIKQFFLNLPKWAIDTPTGLMGIASRFLNKDVTYKSCVWVQDGEQPVIMQVPYDTTKGVLFNPETGEMYDPGQKGDIFFYRKDKFLPLVNCRPVEDKYDVPEHFVMSVYNLALTEGISASDEDIIKEIHALKSWLNIGVIVLLVVIIGNIILFSFYQDSYTSLVEAIQATGV